MFLVFFGSYLQAEGLEKTFKFKQKNIADVVDVTSARKVILSYVINWDREMIVGWGGVEKSDCTGKGTEIVLLHIINK